MHKSNRDMAIGAALLAAALATGNALAADKYPTKPIRFVVPFPPGGGTDIVARVIAQRMTETLGEQVVVDNRGGAGGTIGAEIAARAAPDGYTLIMVSGSYAVNPTLYKLSYDPIDGVTPIVQIATGPFVVLVHPSVPAKNIKELIALAKARPGQLHFGSAGTGSTPHLCGELLKTMAAIDMVHVPYKASGSAMTALAGGEAQMGCQSAGMLLPLITAGKLRALAVAAPQRLSLLPDLPTAQESGLAGFEVETWTGVLAPAKTPDAVIRRLYDEIARIVNTPDMKNFILGQGVAPALMDPAKFGAYINAERVKWAKVIKTANVKPD